MKGEGDIGGVLLIKLTMGKINPDTCMFRNSLNNELYSHTIIITRSMHYTVHKHIHVCVLATYTGSLGVPSR